jgi:hypothetical protein
LVRFLRHQPKLSRRHLIERTALHLLLRDRITRTTLCVVRRPLVSGRRTLVAPHATHTRIITLSPPLSGLLREPLRYRSARAVGSGLIACKFAIIVSVRSSRQLHTVARCYASIKERLLPSLPTTHNSQTFAFRPHLGALGYDLGCFPLDVGPLRPTSDSLTPHDLFDARGVVHSTKTRHLRDRTRSRLCLDTFREEPAITRFDWLITPIRRSS